MESPLNDIKNGDFARVYLLYGPESFLRLDHTRRLSDAIVPKEDGMNRAEMAGEQISEQAIIDLSESVPFFSDRRLIIVKDSGFFEKSCELLPDYLGQIPEHSTIIFCETKADGRNRMTQAVKKHGRLFAYTRPDKRKDKAGYADAVRMRKQWAAKMLSDADLRITEQDMDYLLSRIGLDMSTIRLETDKLINACSGQGVVTRAAIETHTTALLEDRIFEMVEAIARGAQKEALAMYADLLAQNTAATTILFQLGREYRRLHAIRAYRAEGIQPNVIADRLNLHPYVVKKLMPIAMKDDVATLKEKLDAIAKADYDIKSGRLSDRLACEMQILSLMPRSD